MDGYTGIKPKDSEYIYRLVDNYEINISGLYEDNQLVKYSDISISQSNIYISIDTTGYDWNQISSIGIWNKPYPTSINDGRINYFGGASIGMNNRFMVSPVHIGQSAYMAWGSASNETRSAYVNNRLIPDINFYTDMGKVQFTDVGNIYDGSVFKVTLR